MKCLLKLSFLWSGTINYYAILFRGYEKETVNDDLDKDDNKGKKINEQMNLLSTIVLKNDIGRETPTIITVMLEKLTN